MIHLHGLIDQEEMPKELSEDRFKEVPFIPKTHTNQVGCGTSHASEASMSHYSSACAFAKYQKRGSYILNRPYPPSFEDVVEMLRLSNAALKDMKANPKSQKEKIARMVRLYNEPRQMLKRALLNDIEEKTRRLKKLKHNVRLHEDTISSCGTVDTRYFRDRIKAVRIASASINTFTTANGDRAFRVESVTVKNTTNLNVPINLKGLSIACSNGEMVNITNDLKLSSMNRLMELRVERGRAEDKNDSESLQTLSREDDKWGIITLKNQEGKVIEVVTYNKDNVKSGLPLSFEKSEPPIPEVICIVQDDNLYK
jgi:hypothetical protein